MDDALRTLDARQAGGAMTSAAPRLLWAAVPVLLLLSCWAGWWIPLNNDVSWQYWIARQLRGGAVLYRDIVEVNPPLWFWEAVPLSALAERLHVDAGHLAIAAVMVRVMLSLALLATLIDDGPKRETGMLLVGLALILWLLPQRDFAEREHLMLIGALPYVALLARRCDIARPVSARLATLVGLFAAYGFAMKPHLMLVPLGLEVWLAFKLRGSWRPLRPETIALALLTMIYGAAILLVTPDYLRLTLPLARAAYGAFSSSVPSLVLEQAWSPTWLLAILALASADRTLPGHAQAAMVAAAALAIVYFVQDKGFSYHALPVTAMLAWPLLWLLADGGDLAGNMIRRPLPTVALALMVATACFIGPFNPALAERETGLVQRLPPGSVFAVISAHSWLAFPFVETHRLVWPMRNIGLWTIPEIARHGAGATATPQGLWVRKQTLDMIATDLWCHPPDAILFDDPAHSPALRGTPFDYQAFVRSDPRLDDLLRGYRRAAARRGQALYLRQERIAARGDACRTILIRPDLP